MEKVFMKPATKDLTGMKFGRWTVLEFAGYKNYGTKTRAFWHCKCDCGKEKDVVGHNLIEGKTQSCGCLHNELLVKHFTKHGARKTKEKTERLYFTWKNMRARCLDTSNRHYSYYGGRGIAVCDEWKNSYSSFRKWALENGYNESLTIDRIDVNGNYEPSNCRWATRQEQARNKRTNIFIEYNGEKYVLNDLAQMVGVNRKTLKRRIDKGLSVQEAINKDKFGRLK